MTLFYSRLTNHQPLALALELVDLDGFEEVLHGVCKNRFRDISKAAREVSERHDRAIDIAIVTSEEEIHVLVVCNDSLIDRPIWRIRRTSSVEGLRCTPAGCRC